MNQAADAPGAHHRLTQVQQEIDDGLERYLAARGAERQALTIRLMRLRWEQEELAGTAGKPASTGIKG